jgi:hypothetical protein
MESRDRPRRLLGGRSLMFRTLEFRSTFPSQWRFDASENPSEPGARELADAIAYQLAQRTMLIRPVELHSYYGWAFDVRFAGCRFVNVLTPAEERCYLTVQLCWYRLRALLLQRPRQRFDEYSVILGKALAAIPQVSEVVWQQSGR